MANASKQLSNWLRHTVGITGPRKLFASPYCDFGSAEHALPDGSPAVKEDIERYLTGHAGSGAHAGYGKRWIETLKAGIKVIPVPSV
jgi:hypothetical protein